LIERSVGMRVLIADDESPARTSLVSMIQEIAHPFKPCGEAENEEQLKLETKPDIQLLDYQINLGADHIQVFKHQTEFCGTLVFVDSHIDEAAKRQVKQELLDELQNQLRLQQSDLLHIALAQISEDETALITAWNPDQTNRSVDVMHQLVDIIEQKLSSFNHELAAITLISTNVCSSLEKLQEQFAMVSHFAAMRITRGVRRHWMLAQLDASKSEWLLSLGRMIVDLSNTYQHKNYLEFMNRVDQLHSFLNHHGLNKISDDTMLAIQQFISYSVHCQIDPASIGWLEQLYKHGETLLPCHGLKESGERMVERVILDLERDYSRNDIALNEFAKQLRTTSHYLNARFIQATGLTFVKYLAKFRVTRAKEILADPSSQGLQLKKIAEQVGFTSASYFSRCFSENEGCSPTEYRKSIRK
jgi:two-component system, response regulator YesN